MSDPITTRFEMLRAAYKKLGDSKCKSCGAPIEWWQTNNGKKMPFDPLKDLVPLASLARSGVVLVAGSKRHDYAPSVPANSPQKLEAHRKYLAAFRASSNARAIVAIYDDGSTAVWRQGLSGEDLRDECSAASERNAAEAEATARTVDCPSCHQAVGAACVSGSGVERDWAHATRTKLAKRLRRNRKDRA
ncbi:MAG: hypothetical protein ABT04_02520 [Granulicella sp. SCN 62-9]|nr:MAG: hypothetical protein ABT04_02520 [Granulicella sp. SCN 62-9]